LIDQAGLPERITRLGREISALFRDAGGSADPSEGTPTERALRVILTELRRHVPFDSASVQELRGNRLVIVGGIGFADLEVLLGESFEIDNADTPNGEVIYRARPLVVRDTEHYRAFRRGLHVGVNIRSWLGAPLIRADRLVGMLAIDKQEADFFTSEHLNVTMLFATLAAEAMAHLEHPR
jgi:GAF domain-containing protein